MTLSPVALLLAATPSPLATAKATSHATPTPVSHAGPGLALPHFAPWPPVFAVGIPLLLGLVLMPWFIGRLSRAGMGQKIREEGPRDHLAKAGTPTAGGLLVVGLVLLTVLLLDRRTEVLPVVAALVLGASFGLVDDVVTTQGQARGLLARQRIGVQLIIGFVIAYWLLRTGADRQLLPWGAWRMGWLLLVVGPIAIAASTNAFNLTDGSDGLMPGVALVFALMLALVERRVGGDHVALVRILLATIGALAAFLVYNIPPARVFIGGVGAEGLGTMLAAAAIAGGLLWFLPLLAIVPLLETASVIAQVYSFKRYGRRIFRMSPIHHHFQLGGWGEWRVAWMGWAVTLAGGFVTFVLTRRYA